MPLASLFHPKARKWVRGRKGVFPSLRQNIPAGEKIIWVHCASLGEFEQGRPIMDRIKSMNSGHRILLTFFSPSGYESKKDYAGADWVYYLPVDGPRNAKRFLEIVHPSLVIFVKYEFWYYYLKKIKYRAIPLLLVSALFRSDMSFFKWYGGLQRKMLSRFDHLFVQNESSLQLLNGIGLSAISSVSGDTRFDRVAEIAAGAGSIPEIENFIGQQKAFIAGSTWPEDEEAIQRAFGPGGHPSLKLIIAPHEITSRHLASLQKLFPGAVLFSQLKNKTVNGSDASCLLIDNIGMLSRLYRYGYITYIGGGLRVMGVHNVLEAAVYNKPVLFGFYFHKYSEAIGLVQSGGGIWFKDDKKDGIMLRELTDALLLNTEEYTQRAKAAGEFVRSHTGATEKIIRYLQEKRLLTS